MHGSRNQVLAATLVAALSVAFAGVFTPWASDVTAIAPGAFAGGDPSVTLGPPEGAGEFMGSSDVYQLGVEGSITLELDTRAVDGAGTDLVVYENPFHVTGAGNSTFVECLFVEVSSDGTHFARFPTRYGGAAGPFLPGGLMTGVPSGWYRGFAGVQPVRANLLLGISPFDVVLGGGDAFDLAALLDHPAVLSGDVNLDSIRYVRLLDVQGGGAVDSQQTTVWDAGDPIFSCSDLDGVAALNNQVDISGTAGRPAVELRLQDFGGLSVLIVELSDTDGLWTIVEGITASVDGIVVNFYELLGLFVLLGVDAEGATLALGPIPSDLPALQFRIGVVDFTGKRAGDAIDLP